MNKMKNFKFTSTFKNLGPKIKWFLFTELQDYKLTSDYIDFICPDNKKESNPVEKLENMVRQTLIREFSPDIVNSKSFNLMVDTVMHRIQKQSLEQDF